MQPGASQLGCSGGSNELVILHDDPPTASVAVKAGCVDNVADRGRAPGAFSFGLAKADQRAQKRSKDARNNHGDPENRAQPGETKHHPNDDAHGRHNHSEEQPTEAPLTGAFSGSA